MDVYRISHDQTKIKGTVHIDGSKSISNRVLMISALCDEPFQIDHLSTSDDTQRMQEIISSDQEIRDAGPAGTTFRFSTALLAIQPGTQILTGSERMKQRPIGPLVDALRSLGAIIDYTEKEGYPPLRIGEMKKQLTDQITIASDTSSQFISALLLIAPRLPLGLKLTLEGEMVSRSYIQMTLNIMSRFGIKYLWEGDTISIENQRYLPTDFYVEGDWSAASYYYSMAVLSEKCEIELKGLHDESTQGDRAIAEIVKPFGVETSFVDDGLVLHKSESQKVNVLEKDFILCPDIAQTVAVFCGGTDTKGLFSGLQTLSIKETDRIAALHTELKKCKVYFTKLPDKFSAQSGVDYYLLEGNNNLDSSPDLQFATYHDHRMAMAFAPLALKTPIRIEDPMVVIKSYPRFWEDLESLGFVVESEN